MKKLSYALGVTVLAAACADGALQDPDGFPNFAVSDGANGGNPHFFFAPPLVPPADPNGIFNPSFEPTLEIHDLADPSDVRCDPTAEPHTTVTEVFLYDEDETYVFEFVPHEYQLTNGADYRLCVKVLGVPLGFRDVRPEAPGTPLPPDPANDPIFSFDVSQAFELPVRIEEGALCQLNAIDCTEQIIGPSGGQAVCDASLCGIDIPAGAVSQPFLFVVELVDCAVDQNGNVHFIDTDLPQYPGCLEITVEPQSLFNQLAIPALAAACYDAPSLSHDQQDRLQLHHQKDDGSIEALPNAQAGFLDCSNYQAMATDAGPLAIYASKLWRSVKSAVLPGELVATDRGFGGRGFVQESPFVWALPSQMTQFEWSNPETGQEGDVLRAHVKVTDEAGDPVQHASVTFDVTNGNGPPNAPVTAATDATGVAWVDWTLGPAGANRLEASGRGIGLADGADGVHRDNTPPGGTGVFADHVVDVVDLGTGVLHFDAEVCPAGPSVDGVVTPGEYANSETFDARDRRRTVPATFSWGYDCESLYFALEMEVDPRRAGELVLLFDNDADGQLERGDDALSIRRVFTRHRRGDDDDDDWDDDRPIWERGAYGRILGRSRSAFLFRDDYVRRICRGRGCIRSDPAGLQDGTGTYQYDESREVATYEISHPLRSGDTEHDFQLDLGDEVGVRVTIQIGKGSRSRTTFPSSGYHTLNIGLP